MKKKARVKFSIRILDALIRNGVEYETAWELTYYQPVKALNLLNYILKSKKNLNLKTT